MSELFKAEIASVVSAVSSGGSVVFALTDAVSISIITSLSAVIMAGISAFFAYKAKSTSDKTHEIVNNRMEEFKKLFEQTFVARGVEQERKEESQRKASAAQGVLAEKERVASILHQPQVTQEQIVDALKKMPPTL